MTVEPPFLPTEGLTYYGEAGLLTCDSSETGAFPVFPVAALSSAYRVHPHLQ
jgi:hypothetical protein